MPSEIPKDTSGLARNMREYLGFVEPGTDGDQKIASSEFMNLAYERSTPGMKQVKLSPEHRVKNFEEVHQGMTLEDALEEARRCLSCGVCRMCGNCYLFCPDSCVYLDEKTGRYVIDYEFCKGCGICHNECPVATIDLEAQGEE
jgi:Pyruvate/2-oxoacid:ferredoxin oxidoreductase delta subunit